MQLWDQLGVQFKLLTRHSCCPFVSLIIMTLYCASTFYLGKASTKAKEWPEFNLEKLKHPLY